MFKRKVLFGIVAAICCGMALQACVKEENNDAQEYVKAGDEVPSFSVVASDGVTDVAFTPAEFTGKRSLIFLFTTDCTHCQAVLPVVDEVYMSIAGNPDFQVISIARDGRKETLSAYWSSRGLVMDYYLDPGGKAFNKFASKSVPRFYVIDEQGEIEWMQTGRSGITKDFLLYEKLGYPRPGI